MIYYQIYSSSATKLFSQQDLIDLLTAARRKNELLDITGLLLFNRGTFIQILEGDEKKVKALYKTIHKDPRHKLVFTLSEGYRQTRQFPSWSMGFRDLDSPEIKQIPGFNNFINEPHNSEYYHRDPMAAMELLYLFKDVVR